MHSVILRKFDVFEHILKVCCRRPPKNYYYFLLGVEPHVPNEQIQKNFQAIIKEIHPDTGKYKVPL